MTADEMPECAGCGARYTSALAAAVCCEVEFDKPSLVRGYELGYD